jgi:hypothetical protein
MSDESRSGTPPMAMVKSEEWTAPSQPSSASVNAISLRASSASNPRTAANANRNTSNPLLTAPSEPELELELPPRLRPIHENTLRTQPELAEKRYAEFIRAEQMTDPKPQHDADHVKLYFLI